MTHGGIIARIHEDYGLYQVSVGSLGMKAPQQSSAPTEDQHTDTIAWNNDFELFPDLEYYDRITLVKAYLDGIDSIFRSSNHSATTEIVGPEFTHHEILAMAFSRTSEDLDYPVPAHIYLQQRAFCLLSSARKGSIVAGALIRHFVSVLPEKTLLDPEWSWTAVSYGLVLDWDLQAHNPQRHTDARRSFRKKGGYNTHYTMSQNCKPASCGLLANPLEWLETRYPLHHAAALGRMDDLETLLKKEGSYPDELDARGETPLMKACMAGSAECTKLLLRYGARPEIVSKSLGTLPLHWLFVFDPTEIPDIADALYTKEDVPARSICNPDIPAFFFPFRWPAGTPLEWAVFANNTVAIDKLLELGFNLTDVREFFPATPRPRARDNDGILLEHTEALDLLEYCVYFESDMQFNRHPAVQKHRQCENERQSVQQNRLYIVREFRRRALKHYGSELNIAISTKRIQRVEFLLEHGSDINQYFPTASGLWRTTLCGAIGYDGNIELIRFLLEQGANVHGHGLLMNNTNIFPLTVAASLQDLEIVEFLVEKYGANVNSIERSDDYDFGNALQAAILGPKDSEPLVRYLVSKGADVNAEAGRFHTVLQCAALQCDVNIARILLSHGANVNTEGGQRWTALQAAAYQQNYKLVELLVLEHHVNIDACGGYGNHTALMAALTPVATPSIALFLLDHGADFKIHCGKDSRNALQAAVKSGAKTIVKKLLELGADPSVIKGKYLEDAVEAGSVKLLRTLIKGGLKVGREEAIAVLPVAYKWGYVRMAEFLLDMAEDSGRVSAACEEGLGWTPQITSTRGGVYEVVMKHVAKTSSRR